MDHCLHCNTVMPHNYSPDEEYAGDLVLVHLFCSHCEQSHHLLLKVGGYKTYELVKAEDSPVQTLAAK